MPERYDLQIGRLQLLTVDEGMAEPLGDSLEAVGRAVLRGDRRGRQTGFVVPVHAEGAADAYATGERLRRQVRSLFDNAKLTSEGLYTKLAFDPDLNGWLMYGPAELEYAEGGPSLADYKLTVSDAYRIGAMRELRAARRVSVADRRLSTVPRDIEGKVYSTQWAAFPIMPLAALPSGVTDVTKAAAPAASVVQKSGADGGVNYITGAVDADVYSYEQPEISQNLMDVVMLDRRGFTAPAYTLAGDLAPTTYGWEEVYGPNYPLSANDLPVVQNGLCRIRYKQHSNPLHHVLAVDQWVAGTGYVERGVIYPHAGTTGTQVPTGGIRSVRVVEWTPERAVYRFRALSALAGTPVLDIYVILQRGWSGPRVEVYNRSGGSTRPGIYWEPNAAAVEFALHSSAATRISTEGWTTDFSHVSASEPWLSLSPLTGTFPRVVIVPMQVDDTYASDVSTLAVTGYGVTNRSLRLDGGAASPNWGAWEFQIGGTATSVAEAEAFDHAASGTSTVFADGAASGGSAIQETQAASTNPTVSGMVFAAANMPHAIWARVRVGTAGATGSIIGWANTGQNTGAVTFTNTAYAWVRVGEIQATTGTDWWLNMHRSAGAGNTYIDRMVAVPLATPTLDGARDFGQQAMADCRMIQELVAR